MHTPTSGSAPDRRQPTPVGRALARLGIEHILGYSPQARGRSERVNRTLQDRLVNELRVAGIRTVATANRYLRRRFLPAFNAEFARPPADPTSAFIPLGRVDLDQILCVEDQRVVGRDNVVTTGLVPLQLAKQPGRCTCAGLRVLVRRHLDGQHSVVRLPLSGPLQPTRPAAARRQRPYCSPERSFHGVKQHVSATNRLTITSRAQHGVGVVGSAYGGLRSPRQRRGAGTKTLHTQAFDPCVVLTSSNRV